MIPPIFNILSDNQTLTNLIGNSPVRAFPFGEAPPNVEYPYITWHVFSGLPENTLDRAPLLDVLSTQVDVWAKTLSSCLDVASLVRDALEPHAHMTGIGSQERDTDTRNYRVRLDFDFFTER